MILHDDTEVSYGSSAAGCSVGWVQALLTAPLSTCRNEAQTDHGYADLQM